MRTAADMRQTQNRRGLPAPGVFARASAELVLVALLALLVARAVWFAAYGGDVDRLDIDPTYIDGAATTQQGRADLSVLTSTRLFAERDFSGPEADRVSAPETQLDLTLHGVRRGPDPQSGSAIIESPQHGQRTLPVGAEIAPNIILEAIYPDRVIIDRRGLAESLFLREQAQRTRLMQPAGPVPEAVESTPTAGPSSSTRFTQADWVGGLRLERAGQADAVTGYRVTSASDPALLQATDLMAGDIITSVNGRRLDRSVNTLEVLEELAESSSARFTILRAGEARTIEVDLR